MASPHGMPTTLAQRPDPDEVVYVKSLMNYTTTGDLLMNSYVTLSPAKRLEAKQRLPDFIEARLMGFSHEAMVALPLLEFQPAEVLGPIVA